MSVELITLCENTATMPGFLGDWGLSILIKDGNERILFDTGWSNHVALHNAKIFDIDLSTVGKIVLSHAHKDHTGGLREVIRKTGKTEIIAHPAVWDEKYLRAAQPLVNFWNEDYPLAEEVSGARIPYQEKIKFGGIPFRRCELEYLGADFKLSKKPVQVTENVFTTGEVPLETEYEKIGSAFFYKDQDVFYEDTLPDDLSLIIKTGKGLVVVLGCAHRGMINNVRHAQKVTGEERIYAVIGGTHLIGAPDDRINKSIQDLRKIGVKKIGVSHCTGLKASAMLMQEFKEDFFLNNAGSILVFS
ncbi:MAG TPA: MBL fold metallo-hydrolase [Firmicutes bacterium]|jgi:7,8-dihydropterin-6-yl-methyl-4-(beta-D-ribofuranosyl)aminobenzene 5'-phosphate synthase|nr:MBL fold metallo-hydrolase [Bacillota bacterium]